jgi:nitrogen fixation/metabolism regulation signal transduction histidine kinase
LLYQQEHQIRRDQVSINVIREILHQMPFAVIGTDSEEKIVFCNLAAEALFRDQMLPLDEYVGTAMPALLPLLHETMEGAIRELNLHQTLYRACWKAMGQHSTARGKVLILFSPDPACTTDTAGVIMKPVTEDFVLRKMHELPSLPKALTM